MGLAPRRHLLTGRHQRKVKLHAAPSESWRWLNLCKNRRRLHSALPSCSLINNHTAGGQQEQADEGQQEGAESDGETTNKNSQPLMGVAKVWLWSMTMALMVARQQAAMTAGHSTTHVQEQWSG